MKNSTGKTVMVKSTGLEKNCTISHPAIITRDFSSGRLADENGMIGAVNVSIFQDTGHHVIPLTSVPLYESEEAGDALTAKIVGYRIENDQRVPITNKPHFAYFLPGECDRRREPQVITAADVGDATATEG